MHELQIKPIDRKLRIKSVEATCKPGDLGAVISGDDLLLPRQIAEAFLNQGVRSAVDLVAQIDAFPGATARALGWTPAQVATGLTQLRTTLADAIPSALLRPPPRERPGMGAMAPDTLSVVTLPKKRDPH